MLYSVWGKVYSINVTDKCKKINLMELHPKTHRH